MRFHWDGLLKDLDSVRRRCRRCVLLYSGGVDSSYFLWWAVRNEIEVVPVHVILTGQSAHTVDNSFAECMGVPVQAIEATDEFASDVLPHAINADAQYQGIFPVSSSLSRPLMAIKAVEVARVVEADTIVHTAAVHQNSCARFNNALRAIAPEIVIGNPFLEEHISRTEKLAQLRSVAAADSHSIYSIDANIWARVIENGELDFVDNPVPEQVFEWSCSPLDAPSVAAEITLRFTHGIPVAINGEACSMKELVMHLNSLAGSYGIGRFNGVEDTRLGVKNHEVREAPAAHVILLARKHLEQLVLTSEELRIKHLMDAEWTRLVVQGGWYSDLKKAIDAFVAIISRPVDGEVTVTLRPGSTFVSAVRSDHSLEIGGDLGGVQMHPDSLNLDTLRLLSRSVLG